MSSIPFLDNANEGQNNWWKYLLTVIISLIAGSLVAGVIVVLFLVVYAFVLSASGNVTNILEIIQGTLQSPFVLIVLIGVSYAVSFFLFYICLRFLHHKRLLSVINTVSSLRWKMLLKGLILWIAVLAIFNLPDLIFNSQNYQKNLDLGSFAILLVLCLLVFPMQASFEEILFRGYLMQGINLLPNALSKRFGNLGRRFSSLSSLFNLLSRIFSRLAKPWFPILITAIIFGSVHVFNGTNLYMDLSIVASTFIMGLMLGVIALGDNGIETAMGIHIANNLYIALFFNSADSGLGELPSLVTAPASDPFSGIPFMILAALIVLTILFWNRKEDLVKIFR
ncbi:CPBP family intramembrane glutamic endopeptidase [uncultured Methanobacterium sp.]|uniref:CPBP family intramembrane glutamic endopeptidase n=1 Tax=uncultured Methanobacterium sp. TaxID=176306 RepID=UPI002AA95D9B|nr:CPBP family intramembrane glutamic endopeptidase [uncultured Methanobacterium sp.]